VGRLIGWCTLHVCTRFSPESTVYQQLLKRHRSDHKT